MSFRLYTDMSHLLGYCWTVIARAPSVAAKLIIYRSAIHWSRLRKRFSFPRVQLALPLLLSVTLLNFIDFVTLIQHI